MPPKPVENDVVKRPNAKSQYSEENLQQLIRCINDPLYFCETFVRIQHPTKGAVPFILYPYQRRMIQAFHDNRFTVALTARQLGKALALDTPLPTPTGWTTMGEVKDGDLLLGSGGQTIRVVKAHDVMVGRPCYRVRFSDKSEIIADAEHLWVTWDCNLRKTFDYRCKRNAVDNRAYPEDWANWEGRVKPVTTAEIAQTLRHRGQNNHAVPAAGALDLPHVDLPIPPYVLGYLLGDGDTVGKGRVACDPRDREWLISEFRAEGIPATEYSDEGHFGAPGIGAPWRDLKLDKGKHIPPVYLRASYEQRLALAQGLIDSDGYIDTKGTYRFSNTCQRLVDDFIELISSLGCVAKVYHRPPRLRKGNECRESWDVMVPSDLCLSRMQRKIAKARIGWKREAITRYVVAVEPIESIPVRCITVDAPDSIYLCGRSMIPTHNTTCAAAYLLWRAMFVPDTGILITANKYLQALEIMDRIRYAYENLPDFIRAGTGDYNKGTITFDNGSRITSRATSSDAGRGLSISLLYCLAGDTEVTVRDKETGEIKVVTLAQLQDIL